MNKNNVNQKFVNWLNSITVGEYSEIKNLIIKDCKIKEQKFRHWKIGASKISELEKEKINIIAGFDVFCENEKPIAKYYICNSEIEFEKIIKFYEKKNVKFILPKNISKFSDLFIYFASTINQVAITIEDNIFKVTTKFGDFENSSFNYELVNNFENLTD